MFGTLKAWHTLGAMGFKWVGATGVDPGDKGQIVKVAANYMEKLGMNPGDAWLTAMINWMAGMPWPESQLTVAQAMIQFLDAYEGKIALSAATIISARQVAQDIIG